MSGLQSSTRGRTWNVSPGVLAVLTGGKPDVIGITSWVPYHPNGLGMSPRSANAARRLWWAILLAIVPVGVWIAYPFWIVQYFGSPITHEHDAREP